MIDRHVTKIEEWVERSGGKVRADVIHERLVGMGFTGTERTTRRAVAEAKAAWRAGHRRTYRPWVTEPGLWLQFDRSEEHTSELQSRGHLVCRLLLEKKKQR